MFTQTTISMHNYEAGFGKTRETWAEIPQEGRWLNFFKDEQDRLTSQTAALHKAHRLDERGEFDEAKKIREAIEHPYLFQGLPSEVVAPLSLADKEEILADVQRGWMKLAEPANFRGDWAWLDLIDAEHAVQAALIVIDVRLEYLHSLTYQGPVRPQDMGCSQEAVTQAMLLFTSENLLYLRNALTDVVLPKLVEAKDSLRSRMGEVALTREIYCVKCEEIHSGSQGFVVLNATRREGKGNGTYCLECFGH